MLIDSADILAMLTKYCALPTMDFFIRFLLVSGFYFWLSLALLIPIVLIIWVVLWLRRSSFPLRFLTMVAITGLISFLIDLNIN